MMYKIKNIKNISSSNAYLGDITTLAKGAIVSPNGKHAVRTINNRDYPAKLINGKWVLPNKHGYYYRNLYENTYNIPNSSAKGLSKLALTYLHGLNRKRKVQGFQLIINPSVNRNKKTRLNGHNSQDVKAVSKLGNSIAKIYARKGFPTTVHVQSDSKHGLLHCHVNILNYNLVNGRSVPSKLRNLNFAKVPINKTIKRVAHKTNVDFQPYFTQTKENHIKHMYNMSNARKSTIKPFSDYLMKTLNNAINPHATSKRAIKRDLKRHGIIMKLGSRRKYLINPYTNRRIPKRDSNNQILKYKNGKIKYKYVNRPTISYSFTYRKKPHTIKGSTLDKIYSPTFDAKYIAKLIENNKLRRYNAYKRKKYLKNKDAQAKENALNTSDVKVLARNVSIPTQFQIKHVLGRIRPVQVINNNYGTKALKTYRHTMKSRHIEPTLTEKYSISNYNHHLGSRLGRLRHKSHPILNAIHLFKSEANKIKINVSKGAETIGTKLSHHGFNRIGGWFKKLSYKLENHNKPLANKITKSRQSFHNKLHNQAVRRQRQLEKQRRMTRPTRPIFRPSDDGPTL